MTRFVFLLLISAAAMTGCATNSGDARFGQYSGEIRSSDPRFDGERDMHYDHLIVPGSRIGPAIIGNHISEALHHLGNPESESRVHKFVFYMFENGLNISFTDIGFDPIITGVLVRKSSCSNTECKEWATVDGIKLGTKATDVMSLDSTYHWCVVNHNDGGLSLFSRNQNFMVNVSSRNGNVVLISTYSYARNPNECQ